MQLLNLITSGNYKENQFANFTNKSKQEDLKVEIKLSTTHCSYLVNSLCYLLNNLVNHCSYTGINAASKDTSFYINLTLKIAQILLFSKLNDKEADD